jgi:hypothetical protein
MKAARLGTAFGRVRLMHVQAGNLPFRGMPSSQSDMLLWRLFATPTVEIMAPFLINERVDLALSDCRLPQLIATYSSITWED